VEDERDALWQIVLGLVNTVYCVYCSLSIWLEISLEKKPVVMDSPYVFCFSDDVRVPEGGRKAKQMVQKLFKEVFTSDGFIAEFKKDKGAMLLGSHSIRKYVSTHVRKCGVTKDEKEIRGRWKGRGRVSDVYDDVELPFPDAKVAEKLCSGGACFYMYKGGLDIAMMNDFILSKVVPNINK